MPRDLLPAAGNSLTPTARTSTTLTRMKRLASNIINQREHHRVASRCGYQFVPPIYAEGLQRCIGNPHIRVRVPMKPSPTLTIKSISKYGTVAQL